MHIWLSAAPAPSNANLRRSSSSSRSTPPRWTSTLCAARCAPSATAPSPSPPPRSGAHGRGGGGAGRAGRQAAVLARHGAALLLRRRLADLPASFPRPHCHRSAGPRPPDPSPAPQLHQRAAGADRHARQLRGAGGGGGHQGHLQVGSWGCWWCKRGGRCCRCAAGAGAPQGSAPRPCRAEARAHWSEPPAAAALQALPQPLRVHHRHAVRQPGEPGRAGGQGQHGLDHRRVRGAHRQRGWVGGVGALLQTVCPFFSPSGAVRTVVGSAPTGRARAVPAAGLPGCCARAVEGEALAINRQGAAGGGRGAACWVATPMQLRPAAPASCPPTHPPMHPPARRRRAAGAVPRVVPGGGGGGAAGAHDRHRQALPQEAHREAAAADPAGAHLRHAGAPRPRARVQGSRAGGGQGRRSGWGPAGPNCAALPASSHTLVRSLTSLLKQETDNPDLRDRAYIYWRLLSTDPGARGGGGGAGQGVGGGAGEGCCGRLASACVRACVREYCVEMLCTGTAALGVHAALAMRCMHPAPQRPPRTWCWRRSRPSAGARTRWSRACCASCWASWARWPACERGGARVLLPVCALWPLPLSAAGLGFLRPCLWLTHRRPPLSPPARSYHKPAAAFVSKLRLAVQRADDLAAAAQRASGSGDAGAGPRGSSRRAAEWVGARRFPGMFVCCRHAAAVTATSIPAPPPAEALTTSAAVSELTAASAGATPTAAAAPAPAPVPDLLGDLLDLDVPAPAAPAAAGAPLASLGVGI